MISGYKNLIVWIESKDLTILVYDLTKSFPKSEDFGLTSQMRRASVSVMSQLAEGWLRKSKKDKLHYIEIAHGSLLELESHGVIAKEIRYWTKEMYEKFDSQRSKVSFLLYRYRSEIEQK